jgi:TP901 family phage tail tape measure protein
MARVVSVKLTADVAGYMSGLQRAGAATADFTKQLDRAAKGGHLEQTTRAATGLGIGLLGVAGVAVKMRADFEKQMSAVKAATHAGGTEMAQLQAAALQAGKATQFSATEAAKGITELSKAGVSTASILGGGLKGALDLAAAGQIDVSEAAETAASAMTQFKLSGDQVPHIADLLAAAAGKAQGSVHDMGYALNQSGLVAAQFGISIEDTTGALAEFASAGLLGSDAGTSFKTMLLAMANPSGQSKKLMDELGISFYDARGQFIGVSGVAQVLQTRLKGLTEQQRNQALGQIFGNDAIRAASILYTDGATGVQKWAKSVNDSGYASKTAAALTDNLAGDLERLKGSLETMAIEAGGGANSGLRVLTKSANGAIDAFSALPAGLQETAVVLSATGGALTLAAVGFVKARQASATFMEELRNVGPAGVTAATGIGRIAGVAGRLGLVGVAVTGAFMGFKLFGDWVDRRGAPVKANIDKLTASIKDFAATGAVTGELASKYGVNLQKIGAAVTNVTKGMKDLEQIRADVAAGLSDPSLGENLQLVNPQDTQRIKDLDTALTQLVSSGGASQARVFLQALGGSGRLTADQFQRLTGMLPGYTQAAQGAATANSGLAKGFGNAEANAKSMTSSLQGAIDAGQTLIDVWTQLNGAVLGSDKAMLSAQQSIDAVKTSFKENGRAIGGNSEAALKNRIAVGDAAKAAVAAAQAKYEETGSVKDANTVYNGYLGQLKRTLTQSGLTKKQVDQLIGAYAKMPDDVTTGVKVTGAKGVAAVLASLGDMQKALKTGTAPAGGWNMASGALVKAINDPKLRASGGPISGPGGPRDDAIPAMLSNGEYVHQASAVDYYGQSAMSAINNRQVPKEALAAFAAYKNGGPVSWPFPVTAAQTRIPSKAEAMAAVTPAFGGGGPTLNFIINAVHSRFPGMHLISGYRPGATTLSGNRSYHADHRAADWPASHDLAVWWNQHYKAQTKEFISPWNDLNIHNGARHSYTGAIYRQHSGANAHDHIAMAGGGVINEPVYGYGASGRSYSFAERGIPETVIPGIAQPFASGGGGGGGTTVYQNSYQIKVDAPVGVHPAEVGRHVVNAIQDYERGSGRSWRTGRNAT